MQSLGRVDEKSVHPTFAFVQCVNGDGRVYLHRSHVDDLPWAPTCLLRFEVVEVEGQKQARNARYEMP